MFKALSATVLGLFLTLGAACGGDDDGGGGGAEDACAKLCDCAGDDTDACVDDCVADAEGEDVSDACFECISDTACDDILTECEADCS